MTSLSAALCTMCVYVFACVHVCLGVCDTPLTQLSLFSRADCQMIYCNAWLMEWCSVNQH